ncbi:MAG: A/G-specific adenine glycosylase [Prevotellaceae bacterium]|jgi:A/G-specific adenine glycosylase|nr:A/G-specific adenine glycosylase [Prevotellaceae bacterium]
MNLFTHTLLNWYATHKRQLPWRDITDPYRIWISEVILQQTRVAQGYDYFVRFVRRFPDIRTLAAATEEEVLKAWQGLGYYSRARHLHQAARSTNGTFPTTYAGVRALKGVGDYTAAAICSLAYGMPYAVVDGNVYRVLARYFGVDAPIDTPTGKKLFAALADEMLDPAHPADYNQAIMDFGALQCTPASPDCTACPLAETCAARIAGTVDNLPVKQHKTRVTNRYFNYLIIRAGAYIYIHRRTAQDIWQRLFELPLIETDAPPSEESLRDHPQLQAWFTPAERATLRSVRLGVKHVLTHRRLFANLYAITPSPASRPFADDPDYLCIPTTELDRYAFPRLIQSFLSLPDIKQ